MVWFERLGALDAAFLDIEGRAAHMHLGALAIFEGRAPAFREFLGLVDERLDRVPRYRQRLANVPFGRPVWVDDPAFALERHVRHVILPGGGEEAVKALAARFFAEPLRRDRPLWEIWLVEQAGSDRFALVTKTHHCVVDGVSGVDVATAILDVRPTPQPGSEPSRWTPRPAPRLRRRLASSLRKQLGGPLDLALEVLDRGPAGRRVRRELAGGLRPLLDLARLGPAPASSLNRTIGPRRRFETARLDLAAVRKVRSAFGATANDVVLAAVAGALARHLERRGERPAELRVMVPVSVRSAAYQQRVGNRVAAMFVPLPVGEPDPVERLRKVTAATRAAKEHAQVDGILALTRLWDLAPPPLVARAAKLHPVVRWFNLVVTNVPGPRIPLYLLGRKMLAAHPVVPLAQGTTVGIALLGYGASIDVGLLGDEREAPDLDRLAAAIPEALADLVARASAEGARTRAQRPDAPAPAVAAPARA